MTTKASHGRGEDGLPPENVLQRIRIPFVQRARLRHEGGEHDVFLVDVCLLGAFLERADPLPAGATIELSFPLPGNEIPLVARGRVAWRHESGKPPKKLPAGIGVEFVEMSPIDRKRLRELLVEHLGRRAGGRRFARPWPIPPSID